MRIGKFFICRRHLVGPIRSVRLVPFALRSRSPCPPFLFASDLFTPIASLVDQSIRFESPRSTRGATKCGVRMAGDSHLHRLAYGRCVRSAERSGKRRTSDMPETKNERNAREARFWEAQKVRVILSGGWANCMRRSLMGAVRTSLVQAMCQNLPTTDKTLPDLLQYVLKHASQDPM